MKHEYITNYTIHTYVYTSADAHSAVLEAVGVKGGEEVEVYPVHQPRDALVPLVVLQQVSVDRQKKCSRLSS